MKNTRFHSQRYAISFFVGLAALGAGVIAVLPAREKNFTRIEVGETRVITEVVSSREERARGLSGRRDLGSSHGMLFVFENPDFHSIWMKGMYFPIDIVWVNKGKVVDLERNVSPPIPLGSTDTSSLTIYTPDVPAEFVLETRAGFVRDRDIRIGDTVKIFFDNNVPFHGEKEKISREESLTKDQSAKEPPLPGREYFIETLRAMPPAGEGFRINEILKETDAYHEYAISYTSDGLMISGVMNVPRGPVPKGGFPVLILNHGLIDPSVYFSGRGSKREKDFFARHGYLTIHPDYRGHAKSDPNPFPHHDFYVGYTKDVLNSIEAVKKTKLPIFDRNRIGMWGHSMGGGIAARAMALSQDIRAYVLFAPISADVEDNFYELSQDELGRLAEIYGVGESARALYKKMSPIEYFDSIKAPVQIHHGLEDKDVPVEFSEKMYSALQKQGKKVEFFSYPGEPHEFVEQWPAAAERALQFFDLYVKGDI